MPKGSAIVATIAPTGAYLFLLPVLYKLICLFACLSPRIQTRNASEKRAVEAEYPRQILWEQRSSRAQNFGWACGEARPQPARR